MISTTLAIALLIGTVLMLIPVIILAVWYKVKIWKSVIATCLLTVAGTVGTYIWYYFENGSLGGISFYGAVFAVPVVFVLLTFLLRIPYSTLMDLCAPAECIMLAFMKVQCLTSGCCGGRVLFTDSHGVQIVFPSQIAELINGLIIMVVLMVLGRKKPNRGDLYPVYMIIYGVTRFVLNFLRAQQSDFFLGMSPGNVWSILSVMAGMAWLGVLWHKKKTTD